MRYILPPCAIILMASLFPNSSFALPLYLGIILYSILVTVGLHRKATPQVKRQILIAASGAVLTALGVGMFVYLR
jgi:hypothetical protein